MRHITLATLAFVTSIIATGADARHSYHHPVGTAADGYYTNVNGHSVHRPMASQSRPSGATARCRDSSWSFSENHRGTCSHHGGVANWL